MAKTSVPTDQSLSEQFHSAKPALSAFAVDYLLARDTTERANHEAFAKSQDEAKLRDGQLTADQVSRMVNIPRSILIAQAERNGRTGRGDNQIFFTLLMNDLQEQLDEIDKRIAQHLESLRGRYGSDVIGGIADTYLSDAERGGLETDEQKMAALAKKFLDKDGRIKEEYKDLEEAQYVRDWNEARKLRPIVEKYKGRDHLTPDEQREVHDVAQATSLAENANVVALSNNAEFKTTVDKVLDAGRTDQEEAVDAVPSIPL